MKNYLHKTWSLSTQKTAILTLSLCLCLSANMFAATFTSVASGAWTAGGTWDQSGAVPTATDDIVIASGHTITLAAITPCNSLTVNGTVGSALAGAFALNIATTLNINNTGGFTNVGQVNVTGATAIATGANWLLAGQFTSNGNVTINGQFKGSTTAGTTLQTWILAGVSPTVEVNGTGTTANGTLGSTTVGASGESIRIFLGHTGTATFKSTSGTPVVNIARLHTNSNNAVDQNTDIDINMNLNSTSTAAWALSLQQGNNGTAVKKLTIKANRTVTITNAAGAFHSIASTPLPSTPQGNMTYEIESGATLDVSAGRIYFYTTSDATSSSQQIAINVLAGGTLKPGGTVHLMRNQPTQTVNINVAAGATVDGSATVLGTLTNVSGATYYSWFTLASGAIFKRRLNGGTVTVFPIGATAQAAGSNAGYNPVSINGPASPNVAVVGVALGNTPAFGVEAAKAVNVTWDIKPDVGSTITSATLAFGYNIGTLGASQVGGSYSDVTPLLIHHTGSVWEFVSVSGTGATSAGAGTDKKVTFAGAAPSSFSPFSVGNSSVLPVEFQSITAKLNGSANTIAWTTASEKDNTEFQIERSNNGTNFTSIGTVKGSGTTNTERSYNFNDEVPLSMSYYRLRQTDVRGTSTVSKVVSVAREKGSSVRSYPSVTSGELTVEVPNNAPISISISDLTGRTMLTKTVTGTEKIDVSQLSTGTYFLTLTNAGVRTTEKFVKQ